ncbi:MAG: UvrB/UvrC motif-containing protein, partial [Magnetovibrio sp.]|nr:UvrB/UvrC motif-containing protein [Magnetovibrio sp.]
LYADRITASLDYAMTETSRTREKQEAYNIANGITPASVKTRITDALGSVYEQDYVTVDLGVSGDKQLVGKSLREHIVALDKRMKQAAADLEFEEAGRLRDEIRRLEAHELGLDKAGVSIKAADQAGAGPKRKKR